MSFGSKSLEARSLIRTAEEVDTLRRGIAQHRDPAARQEARARYESARDALEAKRSAASRELLAEIDS